MVITPYNTDIEHIVKQQYIEMNNKYRAVRDLNIIDTGCIISSMLRLPRHFLPGELMILHRRQRFQRRNASYCAHSLKEDEMQMMVNGFQRVVRQYTQVPPDMRSLRI